MRAKRVSRLLVSAASLSLLLCGNGILGAVSEWSHLLPDDTPDTEDITHPIFELGALSAFICGQTFGRKKAIAWRRAVSGFRHETCDQGAVSSRKRQYINVIIININILRYMVVT